MSRLENWSVIGGSLVGIVFDDPRFSDGDIIRTTLLESLDLEKNTAQTKNTLYTLGKPFDGADASLNNGDTTQCVRNEKE